jgi:uncharacterized membrane protein
MTTEVRATSPSVTTSIWSQLSWWILVLPVAMIAALAIHSYYLLDYTHVLSGALWTGADLFLGFILGPVMRLLDPLQRKAVITYLVPRTLLYMPIVAFTTGTAGWFLADWEGLLLPANPIRPWVYVALVMVLIMTVQGLGVLLPNNLRIYRELQRPQPDIARITRINRTNLILAGIQGVFQVLIILVMAHLRVG